MDWSAFISSFLGVLFSQALVLLLVVLKKN